MAAAGDEGAQRAVEIFRADIVRTLKLLGCASIRDVGRDHVWHKPDFRVD